MVLPDRAYQSAGGSPRRVFRLFGRWTRRWVSRLLCALAATAAAGVLAPAAAAQTPPEDAAYLDSLLIESDLGKTRLFPAFDSGVFRYDGAVPGGETEVTVRVTPRYPDASVEVTSTNTDRHVYDIDPDSTTGNTSTYTLTLLTDDTDQFRVERTTSLRVTVSKDGKTQRYTFLLDVASTKARGWRVYDDVPLDRFVDDERIPSHYTAGIWASGSRLMATAQRSEQGTEPFDRWLFVFNTADGSRLTDEEFALVGDPYGGLWSDGTTLWSMDDDGTLRAYDVSDPESADYGSEIKNLHADVRPEGYGANSDVDGPRGITSDGDTLWVVDRDNDKVVAFALPDECSRYNNYCRRSSKDFNLSDGNDDPWGHHLQRGRRHVLGQRHC